MKMINIKDIQILTTHKSPESKNLRLNLTLAQQILLINTLKTPDPLKMFGLPTFTPGPPFSTRVNPIRAEMMVCVLVECLVSVFRKGYIWIAHY